MDSVDIAGKISPTTKVDYEKLYKRLLLMQYFLFGYPRTNDKELEAAKQVNGPQSELMYYYLLHKEVKAYKVIYPTFGIYVVLKATYYLHYLVTSVNELEASLAHAPSNRVTDGLPVVALFRAMFVCVDFARDQTADQAFR